MQQTKLRPTVACLVMCVNQGHPLILTHCSPKAVADGKFNCTTVGGRVNKGEKLNDAARREISEEYGHEGPLTIIEIPNSHFENSDNGKAYDWVLVLAPKPFSVESNTEVFGSPNWARLDRTLLDTIPMSPFKRDMFGFALQEADRMNPMLGIAQAIAT